VAVFALGLVLAAGAGADVLYSRTDAILVNDNGAGANLPGMSETRDETSSDTLYFRFVVEPISDFQTEPYFAALQLYEGGAGRLGVGNTYDFHAYSAFNSDAGDVNLNSATPESGEAWQLVRYTDVTEIVFKVDYRAGDPDAVTVWLDPDPMAIEADQPASLTTSLYADASFDEIRLREGISGGGDGWTFRDIRVAETFAEAVAPVGLYWQFQAIQHSGAGLAFRLGVLDDPTLFSSDPAYCRHYQGLARMDVGGVPYFFLTRSGNNETTSPFSPCYGDREIDNPGELAVVAMGSRDDNGERLRSNRLAVGTEETETLPPPEDIGVAHIHFIHDDIDGEPERWMHPGGVQIADGVLVIAMQNECDAPFDWDARGVGAYTCPSGSNNADAAGLMFVDVSDPLSPQVHKVIDLLPLHPGALGGYGAVAAIREAAGTYLFATMKSPYDPLDFWRSTTTNLLDSELSLVWVGDWDPWDIVPPVVPCTPTGSEPPCDPPYPQCAYNDEGGVCSVNSAYYNPEYQGWWGWQMINFVRDADGELYLIAGDGDDIGEPVFVGNDWIRMFRVTESGGDFRLEWAGEDVFSSQRQLETEYPQKGNMKAASGVYVSPTGQLIVYTGHHDRFVQDGTKYVAMGEYHNVDVHVSTVAQQAPILEAIDADGDDQPETACSGWIELYNDAYGWDDNYSPVRGVMFDYRDRHLEEWDNLHGDIVFGDATSALRWNLPPGQRALLFEDAGYGGLVRNPIPEGTGNYGHLGSFWHDRISSVRLTPVAELGGDYSGKAYDTIRLAHANPCYVGDPPGEPFPIEFEWTMADEFCEPIVEPRCSFSDTTASRPDVTCDEEGTYYVRLQVRDTLPLSDSQFPWLPPGSYDPTDSVCAVLYVPEPGRLTLLAAGLSGLVAASRWRARSSGSEST
jgi:hypothetical protein